MTFAPARPLTEMLEHELTEQIIGTDRKPGLARMFGFAVYHTLRSKGSQPGYPDWTLVRERVVWLELKTMKNPASPTQKQWIGLLLRAKAEVYLVRPDDFDDLGHILAARTSPDTGLLSTVEAREARAALLARTREAIA